MPHQPLYDQQIGALFEVVCGKTVPEGMRGIMLFNVRGAVSCIGANGSYGRNSEVGAFSSGSFKKVMLRLVLFVVISQNRK